MTTLTLFKAVMQILAVAFVCYCIYHEKSFIRFERKAFKVVKCFFKACVITVCEAGREKSLKNSARVTRISDYSNKTSSYGGSVKKDEIRIA